MPTLPDIIVITESKLHNDINNSELNLKGYVIHRCDRLYKKITEKGGGILVAVKAQFPSRMISFDNLNHEEIIVQVMVGKIKCYFLV